jgi:hypothetical protein
VKASQTHRARKELFRRGIQQGSLTVQEIERALPASALSDAERWLLYYSLQASGVVILDATDGAVVPISDGPTPPSS